jgi:glycosyltransferase involved in cell wall biosynthesis/ribosomal protein S18 acetylase RimI-like enzyme
VEVSVSANIRVAHVATIDATHRFLLLAQLRRLRDDGFEVAAISAPGSFVRALELEGIRHIAWPGATRAWDLGSDARAFISLVRILRGEGFAVVHTHNPKPGILGRLAARAAGVPCVVNTVHGYYATPDDPLSRKVPVMMLEWLAARLSDLELFQSRQDLEWARRLRVVSPDRSAYLGNGTDLDRFQPGAVSPDRVVELKTELGIPQGVPVVGTVGRMVAEKGFRELFTAMDRVAVDFPGARLLVVGPDDPRKWDSVSPAEVARAGSHVVATGWREDVRDLLAILDVFVLASWREGVPRSAIEAAAMGRSLVLTDIRGCREVARHEREGLLVPPGDSERLAAAIHRLLGDRGFRERLGSAARSRAAKRFDERQVTDVLVKRYGQVLERKGVLTRQREIRQVGSVSIRRATSGDAGALARAHRLAHPQAFLPMLGEPFLRQLYQVFTRDPGAVALVAEQEGRMIGFATGVLSTPAFYRRFLRQRGVRAAIAAAPQLLRPGIVRRVLETARYPERVRALPDPEFTTLAVASGVRARGLGGALAEEIVTALADRGAHAVRGTVSFDNEPMNRMMRRVGFEQVGETSLHDGRRSILYVIRCRSSSPRSSVSS